MNFAEMVREALEAQGVTQMELASRIGASNPTIFKACAGRPISDKMKWKIANALGIDMAAVFPARENMSMGQWAKLWRKRRGMTGAELAEAAKITKPVIYALEGDKMGTNIFSIIQLADALNIGIDEYIGRRVKA